MRFLVRVLTSALGLAAAAYFVDGITVDAATTQRRVVILLIVAAVFGVINAVVRPILKLLALPLIILTLGLFIFVLNGFLLLLTSWVSGLLDIPFTVDGFWSALLGALIITVVTFVVNVILPDRYET